MTIIIDDIGSFPLPESVKRKQFDLVYPKAFSAMSQGKSLDEGGELEEIFYYSVKSSLWKKIDAGLDVINYPQHYDMHKQFMEPIMTYQDDPFLIDGKKALIPEISVAKSEAREYFQEKGEKLKLKVCVTGPIELYLKTEFGFNIYEDILHNLAISVNRFLKNSIVDSKYMEVPVVSIDEPSLGFTDLMNIEKEGIIKILDLATKNIPSDIQIHLHTLKAREYPLESENINVLTGEFASTPKNIDLISKRELEENDKFIRGGIASTNIDFKIGYYISNGLSYTEQDLVDPVDMIQNTLKKLKEKFGERMTYAGPDCGLGSWPSQDVAKLVLERTVETIQKNHGF